MRRVFFWGHLCLGVTAGLVVLVMSVTGVMLAFERQISDSFDPPPRVAVAPGAVRLPLDSLVAKAGVPPAQLAAVTVPGDPSAPVQFRTRTRQVVLVDPYAGTRVARPGEHAGVRETFEAIERWHRWLGRGSEGPALQGSITKAITGAANLMFLGLVLSGVYLWFPRKWSVAAWRASAVPRATLAGRARDWNWHNAFGCWAAPVLFCIVLSGVFLSYRWPGRLLDRVAGDAKERAAAAAPAPSREGARGGPPGAERAPAGAAPSGVPGASLDALFAAATADAGDWTTVTLALAAPGEATVRATVSRGNGFRPDQRTTRLLDAASGAVVATRDYRSQSLSRRLQGWVRFGHTGQVFGVPGQVIAMLASAVGALLVWTGLALAGRRALAWRRRGQGRVPA